MYPILILFFALLISLASGQSYLQESPVKLLSVDYVASRFEVTDSDYRQYITDGAVSHIYKNSSDAFVTKKNLTI